MSKANDHKAVRVWVFPAYLAHLKHEWVEGEFRQYLESVGANAQTSEHFATCVWEVLLNIITYGFFQEQENPPGDSPRFINEAIRLLSEEADKTKQVMIKAHARPGKLVVTISHNGLPFRNWREVYNALSQMDEDPLGNGGRGIKWITYLMSKFRFLKQGRCIVLWVVQEAA